MSVGESIPKMVPLSAAAEGLLAEIAQELGTAEFVAHSPAWRAKAREDATTLRKAFERLLSRPAVPPIRNRGAWLHNTYHRLREDAVMASRAAAGQRPTLNIQRSTSNE